MFIPEGNNLLRLKGYFQFQEQTNIYKSPRWKKKKGMG
jgi:hypothetical protein